MHRVPIFKLESVGQVLPPGDVHQIRRVLDGGGMCLLPSDTCYAIAVQPLRRGTTQLLDRVLARGHAKISLSFASQLMVERFVDLGVEEYRILDASDRSTPITVVAPISEDLDPQVRRALPAALFTDDRLGVRLPTSWVERQISAEIDGPVTSAAIYYPNGDPVRDFDDALEITTSGMDAHGIPFSRLVAVRHPTIRSQDVSSVVRFDGGVGENRRGLRVLREAAVGAKQLSEIAGRISFRDVEEWT